MTQQNNNPEDPRDSSKDLTRPLNAPDENIQSSEPTSHEAEATAPHQRSSQGNVDSSSQQSPPQSTPQNESSQGSHGQNNTYQPGAYSQQPLSGQYGQNQNVQQNNAYAQAGAPGYAAYENNNGQQNPYGATPYANGGAPSGKRGNNVLGLIALGASVLGLILGCIPVIFWLGWILMFAGFVMGIIALVQKNKSKWAGITAIAVSVVGSIISLIIVFVMAVSSFDATDGSYSSNSESSSSSSSVSAAPASTTGNIGDTYTWEDGVSVTISQPESFTPDKYFTPKDDSMKDYQKYKITIKNDSDQAVDATLFSMNGISGGKSVENVYGEDLERAPSAKIQPGKSVTFTSGFLMEDHNDVSFDVYLDYDRDEVTFIQE